MGQLKPLVLLGQKKPKLGQWDPLMGQSEPLALLGLYEFLVLGQYEA